MISGRRVWRSSSASQSVSLSSSAGFPLLTRVVDVLLLLLVVLLATTIITTTTTTLPVLDSSVFTTLLTTPAAAWETKLNPRTEECYVENLRKGSTYSVVYSVIHGGDRDMAVNMYERHIHKNTDDEERFQEEMKQIESHEERLKLTLQRRAEHDLSPSYHHEVSDKAVYSSQRRTEGYYVHSVDVEAPGSHYQLIFCFSNKHSSFVPKWINFQVRSIDDAAHKYLQRNSKGFTTEEVDREAELHGMASTLFNVHTKLEAVKTAELEHRELVESTNAWIAWGTVFNWVLLAGMAIAQYLLITRFLVQRAASGRV